MSRRDHLQAIERWRSSLLKLPDEVFFDIMRNYLGELKTPFNKHSLVEELSSFLRNAKTQARIVQQIDETDAQLLTAVQLLDRPSLERLFAFFEGTMSYLELHYLLLNFQERLLVFIEEGGGPSPRLCLNPFLETAIRADVLDAQLLFPSVESPIPSAALPWPSESLLLALYSFLRASPDLLKADGSLKKRAGEELAAMFPDLAGQAGWRDRARLLFAALERLGLLRNDNGVMTTISERWQSLSQLDEASRRVILWTAIVQSFGAHDGGAQYAAERPPSEAAFAGGAFERDARVISNFLANLETGRAYAALSLERILSVFSWQGGTNGEWLSRPAAVLAALATTGVLLPISPPSGVRLLREGDEWFVINPHLYLSVPRESRTVIVEPNFQMTLKPGVDFAQGLVAASIAEIRHYDVYPHYEITKRAFVRSLERGRSEAEVVDLLEELGESRLPQNIRFSLASWEKEFRGLALYRGIVLTADNERRHLIEHSEAMKPWIRETLAPGVYLLDQEHVVEWSRALSRCGIDPLPAIRPASTVAETANSAYQSLGEPLRLTSVARRENDGGVANDDGRRRGAEQLTRSLLEALSGLGLPSETVSDLTARINKKLILFTRQLNGAQMKVEKNEAKGIDYIGKVRLVEQALRSGSELLEILERTSTGSSRRLLVRPLELRKSSNDLILSAQTLPELKTVQVVVRKIALVRKLKSSLYAP